MMYYVSSLSSATGCPQPIAPRNSGELVLHVSVYTGQEVQRVGLANLLGLHEIHQD